jgi:hypothetical protein
MKTGITSTTPNYDFPISGIMKLGFFLFISLFSFMAVPAKTVKVNHLPVQYNELSIYSSGHNLILSWQADKSTFDHFEVERSLDGRNYSTVGLVLDAPDNSNTCLFKDKKPSNLSSARVWYRVKGINKNGTMFYSTPVSYLMDQPVSDCTVTVSPNPVNEQVLVKFCSKQEGLAEVRLQGMNGEILLSKQSIINKGSNTIQLEGLNKLVPGIYMTQLLLNGTLIDNQRVVRD